MVNKLYTKAVHNLPLLSFFLLSISAIAYIYATDLILIYNDSRSHLNIARRVIDNLTPGITQFGGTWLPLYHMLSVPFIWNNFLFYSGLAGSIISGLAYVGACFYLYKTLSMVAETRYAIIFALLIFMLNPNLLYLQAVPLTETLLLFSLNSSFYYLFLWAKVQELPYLIISAFLIFLGTLIRYDAWFVLIFEAIFIFLVSLKNKNYKNAEGNYVTFLTLSVFGIVLWLLWNFLIWGNPLYFLLGEHSARAQQQLYFETFGALKTKFNLIYSIQVFISAMNEGIGSMFVLLGFAGFVLLMASKERSSLKMFGLILISPVIFNIISLFGGISVIFTRAYPSPEEHALFNVRYGIMGLPVISVLNAYLIDRIAKRVNNFFIPVTMIVIAVALQIIIFYGTPVPVVVEDGLTGKSAFRKDQQELSEAIHGTYKGGLILMSAGGSDPVMFASGLPMKTFIHEGTAKYWQTSLLHPETYASYIVMCQDDIIQKSLHTASVLKKKYKEVFNNSACLIYERT